MNTPLLGISCYISIKPDAFLTLFYLVIVNLAKANLGLLVIIQRILKVQSDYPIFDHASLPQGINKA